MTKTKTREIIVRGGDDGYRVVSYDGTEYWDLDGPFAEESEAEAAAEWIRQQVAQAQDGGQDLPPEDVEDDGAAEEAAWYEELNRGYAQDRI